MSKTVKEQDYVEALHRLKPFLKWANAANRVAGLDAWAVRQALITALAFMEYHAVKDGLTPAEIVMFDAAARQVAKDSIPRLLATFDI